MYWGAISFPLQVNGKERLLSSGLQLVPHWGVSQILLPASRLNFPDSLIANVMNYLTHRYLRETHLQAEGMNTQAGKSLGDIPPES